MTERFDIVVVGAGAAGLAAARSCAARGLRVLALERFEPGHRRGSSHGTERIVRFGHADPIYVRFALEALELWRQIEADGRVPLLELSGAVDMGDEIELSALCAVSEPLGVAIEMVETREARRRWPGIAFDGPVVHQPTAGTVHADRAVSVFRRLAAAGGATMRATTAVHRVEQLGEGVAVHVEDEVITAPVAVVTAGAWASDLLHDIVTLPGYRVTQEQLAFFKPRIADAWPAFRSIGSIRHYGMATRDGLVKVAEHHTGPVVHPDRRSFTPEPVTWTRLVDWVAAMLPGVDPDPVDQSTCLYASTESEDFVLDRVGDVVIGAGLSGHGFKFLPAIGERLADLATGVSTDRSFTLDAPPKAVGGSGHK